MERLAEQIVDWHNRNPLARRISVGDVHTIGVIALPFVRGTAEAGGLVEPVLTDAVSFDELAAMPRPSRAAAWLQRLQKLQGLTRLLGRRPRDQWRAFNEKFLPGLSPARIERFALAHGFTEPPATPDARPWRVIVIDEQQASAHSGWPFELYLMSAGIDAGSGRTRVLSGRGIPSQVIGRRLLDPVRTGIAAAVLALLAGLAGWMLWPRHAAEPVAEPAPAASAPASTPASIPASAPAAPVVAQAASAAASQVEAAAVPASEIAASDAQADIQPDIRPRLVQRTDGIARPPLLSSQPAATEGRAASAPVATQKASEVAEPGPEKPDEAKKAEPPDPRLARMAQPGQTVVALVGPPGTKAEAEALLKKMRAGLVGVHSNPDALQADVIQTPEGWRATIWPFPSREQAQLINATLVARGMKTKAVNF